ELLGEFVHLGALLADDHADPAGVDEDGHLLAGPLDLDLRDAGLAVAPLDEPADLVVLDQELAEVLLVGVPAALPIDHDPSAEAGRPNLLTHNPRPSKQLPLGAWRPTGQAASGGVRRVVFSLSYSCPDSSRSDSVTWMWAYRRLIMYAVPRAR